MIPTYFKFEVLQPEIKAKHKIRSKTRLDCTAFTNLINYKGFNRFINHKGQLFIYLSPAKEVVSSDIKRRADKCITNEVNITSLYFEDLENKQFAYGDIDKDCLLFIVNTDYTQIEIFVIPNCKNLQTAYYQKLLDSCFDEIIEKLRIESKPFFNY